MSTTIDSSTIESARHADAPGSGRPRRSGASLTPRRLLEALPEALRKLDPRRMARRPVMFIVEVGAAFLTLTWIVELITGTREASAGGTVPASFTPLLALLLWLTAIFANLAEAVAEGRGKAQADALRATRTDTWARRLVDWDRAADPEASTATVTRVSAAELSIGDHVIVEAGEIIPGDGDIVFGVASVDESAITGESAPVVREAGGDRSAVTGGTRVTSDRIIVRITSQPGQTFVDRMIALVEGSQRQRTPNEIALEILLAGLTIVFLVVCLTIKSPAEFLSAAPSNPVLVALLVCLIPTTIGALVSAIGIAGMDRLVQHNVLATSGRAVEAAGDVDTLLLDKTGTITHGNRSAAEITPVEGVTAAEVRDAAVLSSLADATPEGKSIVDLGRRQGSAVHDAVGDEIPFSARTRMSGIDLPSGTQIRKGAASAVLAWVAEQSPLPDRLRAQVQEQVDAISRAGGTALVVACRDHDGARPMGTIHLKDIVKDGLVERFAELRRMGIRTVMITGDNPVTARVIADEAGVDDVLAEATPEDKLALIRKEQEGGRLVAMTGDGTNDAPALAQSDVGVAMNSGTSAAKEAANMVDLDSDPTKLIDIVRIGKQLLITRGSLTTFSIANDVAKYFAIIPAMFAGALPSLAVLNIMGLSSAPSAILSAVIFNALVILALIPLALKGVSYKPGPASQLLTRNLLVYGVGGLIAPFIGIKLIDLLVSLLPGY